VSLPLHTLHSRALVTLLRLVSRVRRSRRGTRGLPRTMEYRSTPVCVAVTAMNCPSRAKSGGPNERIHPSSESE